MILDGLGNQIFEKLASFTYAIGFFSEPIMLGLGFYLLLLKNQILDLFVFLIGFVANALMNRWLRSIIKQPRPDHPIKFLESEHFVKSRYSYGMPSGHSQNVFYSIVFLYLCASHNISWLSVCILIGLLMFIERWLFHNHTAIQLIVGAIIGSLVAYLIVFIKKYIEGKK
jgi:membrane-associated phospholipid phosphatase